ncbi:MAG: MFS transporter [Planctomycetota bacterium]|jgi:DHA1 family multidrug resistance protein-like MFS transporter
MKKCLIILFFCLFVVMIGYGLTLPVLPFYIERLALAEGATVSEASFQVGVLTGIFALMQFFFAPLWGKWSDQLGRRPLFSMGLGGYAISMFLFGMGTNLAMLYAARILGGILSAAVLPMANAYVADVTSEKDRGRGMAWLGSAISLGIVVGPALGAFLSQLDLHLTYRFAHFSIDGFSVPFFAAGLLSLLTLAAAMGWLPESLEPQCVELPGQRAHVETTLNLKSTRWFVPGWLGPFLVLAFLNQFALATFEGTFALHAQQSNSDLLKWVWCS